MPNRYHVGHLSDVQPVSPVMGRAINEVSLCLNIPCLNQLVFRRLIGLGHLCTTWKGWVAAVMHIASDTDASSLLSALALWHADLEKVGMSALSMDACHCHILHQRFVYLRFYWCWFIAVHWTPLSVQ